MKKYLTICLLLLFFCTGCNISQTADAEETTETTEYLNKEFKVSLRHPVGWIVDPGYYLKYKGDDGFFQIDAAGTGSISIDALASMNANHKLQPFGTQPEITELTIDNQEARLITPSDDQAKEYDHAAYLIIRYPIPVKIGDTVYSFLTLNIDLQHMDTIYQTIRFL